MLPLLVHGEVYQWVDDNGHVHFGNVPPKQQPIYKQGEYGNESSVPTSPAAPPKTAQKKQNKDTDAAGQSVSSAAKGASSKTTSKAPSTVTKRRSAHEVDVLIERLRREGQAARLSQTGPAVKKNGQKENKLDQETEVSQKPGPSQEIKPVEEATSAPRKSTLEKNVSSVVAERKDVAEDANPAGGKPKSEKNADKCGLFTDFVNKYELKAADGCPGAHCSVYKRSLKKYKLKQARYC